MGSIDLLWANGLDRSVVGSWARSICCGLMGSIDLLWAPGLDRPVGLIDLFLVGQNSPWNFFIVELDGSIPTPTRSNDKNVTYKLHKGRWKEADLSINRIWSICCSPSSYCVIENVFYNYIKGGIIRLYDPKQRGWTALKGFEGLPRWPDATRILKLADHGGKIAILWKEYDSRYERETIWCAEFALEKRQNGEILGTLE
ncbi:unnamed protein product [Microthlaspi erraticum]|uniref:FKB95-like N-terminal Kelch domain-containing protein n=1 Tax=Microthlaspi erraticum TaxID=1685480 RepID=A0A6D2I3G5_9BRAS|nr:unnamed protein product [Microthlaspi erraticum]